LDLLDHLGDRANGQVVRHWSKPAGSGGIAFQSRQQPVGMRPLQVPLHTLGAEHPMVKREFIPGLKANHLITFDLQLNTALLAAKAAMGFDQPVDTDAGIQPLTGAECSMRSKVVVGL